MSIQKAIAQADEHIRQQKQLEEIRRITCVETMRCHLGTEFVETLNRCIQNVIESGQIEKRSNYYIFRTKIEFPKVKMDSTFTKQVTYTEMWTYMKHLVDIDGIEIIRLYIDSDYMIKLHGIDCSDPILCCVDRVCCFPCFMYNSSKNQIDVRGMFVTI